LINNPQVDAMATVLNAQAQSFGWSTLVLNNNVDGPTALQNAETMIARHVNYAVEFQADATVQPIIAAKFAAAHIPEIVFDIPAPGAYFVGAPNTEAGILAGLRLGDYAQSKWNCKPDLLIVGAEAAAGLPSTLRAAGIIKGLKEVCPNIPSSDIVNQDAGTTAATAETMGRNVLAAHPTAKKILVSGISDTFAIGIIDAAVQLGRAQQLYAWGDDGSGLLSGSFPSQLKGSVWFGLEGYGLYAVRLIALLQAGAKITNAFSPTAPNASLVDPCVISASQVSKIPSLAARVAILEKASPTADESQLLCPAGGLQTAS
jgi:ribose transport system substrate-binding protein